MQKRYSQMSTVQVAALEKRNSEMSKLNSDIDPKVIEIGSVELPGAKLHPNSRLEVNASMHSIKSVISSKHNREDSQTSFVSAHSSMSKVKAESQRRYRNQA